MADISTRYWNREVPMTTDGKIHRFNDKFAKCEISYLRMLNIMNKLGFKIAVGDYFINNSGMTRVEAYILTSTVYGSED